MRGTSMDKKKAADAGRGARSRQGDHRRSAAHRDGQCLRDRGGGKENFLHLAINPGTDLVLLNALMTEVVAKGWQAKDFIAKNTSGFDETLAANKTSASRTAAKITGLDG